MPKGGKPTRSSSRSPVEKKIMTPLVVSPLAEINVDELYSQSREMQRNFTNAGMWAFLQLSKDWPEPSLNLCKQFLQNFEPESGKSQVNGKLVELTESQVETHLQLPTADLPAEETIEGKEATHLYEPHLYFKTKKEALKKDGWMTADAITPQLVLWMRFVNKRLALKVHFTYLHPRLLEATMGTAQGCRYNWAAFVTKVMVQACISKKAKGGEKFLCGVYLTYLLKKQLNIPMNEKELFGARTSVVQPRPQPATRTIVTPVPPPVATPPPVTARQIGEASTSTAANVQNQSSTREQIMKLVMDLQTAVLGLESVEAVKRDLGLLHTECSKAEREKNKMETAMKAALQDKAVLAATLKTSQNEVVKLNAELEHLRATTVTATSVLNGQVAALKDQVNSLSLTTGDLESHNEQLEEQLTIVTTQLEEQLARSQLPIVPESGNSNWAQEKRDLEHEVAEFMEMNSAETEEWKHTVEEQTAEIEQLKLEIARLQNPTALALTETAEPLWCKEIQSMGRRICDVLHLAPIATSLEEQYQWEQELFLAMVGELNAVTRDVFRQLWEVCTYWGRDNLLVEIIMRGDLGVVDPVQLFLACGDFGARVFEYYRSLEGLMADQKSRDFPRWDRKVDGTGHVACILSTTKSYPVVDQMVQWKKSITRLATIFEDERAINELVAKCAQRIRGQGISEILPTEYLLMFTNTRNRLRKYHSIDNFLSLQPFEIEKEVSFCLPEQGALTHTQEDPYRLISSSTNLHVSPFVGCIGDCMDETGKHLNWPTLMWITKDSGPSRRAEELRTGASSSEQLTAVPTGVGQSYIPPPQVMYNPLYCNETQRRGPWIPTATPTTFPYNWPIIPGNFSSPVACREAYHSFYDKHRNHYDPVCFRAALFSFCLGNWCGWFHLTINANISVEPDRQDWAIFSKLHYQCTRHIRTFEEMCVTGFLIGAADQFTNELGQTRLNGLKQYHEWQNQPAGEPSRGQSASPNRKRGRS